MTAGRGEDTQAPTDRELLAAHLDGDAEAFGLLFRRHRDRLWAVALRTTGNQEEAADALQEAMISAFRRAHTYRGDAAVTTWLHRIVVNACLDRLRRAKVRSAETLPDDVEFRLRAGDAASGSTWVTDPADLLLEAEHRAAVLATLDALPPDQKAALVLVDLEGFSVDEAAQILDCPPGTVKSRCSRGRARLVPILQDLLARNRAASPRVQPDNDERRRGIEEVKSSDA